MAYNTKAIKSDKDGKPIPQVFNPLADDYEALKGDAGAARQVLYDKDGNVVSVVSGKLAVRAAELESALGNILSKIIAAPATAAKQDSLETVLKAIRDSAGIKKIADPLPAGTNKIGKVEVDGNTMEKHGLLANRPVASSVPDGFLYFAVDAEEDKLCYALGSNWEVVE